MKFHLLISSTILALVSVIPLNHFRNAKAQPATAAETQEITIQFQGMVGNKAFQCGESYSVGMPASSVTPTDFRLYISEVALIDAEGNAVPLTLKQDGKWQYENVALLDFEDKSGACANGTEAMNDRIVGTVPAGTYTGLQFTLGVPFELNHADATLAPSPLNLTSLWWNWQTGYKFLRIDLRNENDMAMSSSDSSQESHSHPPDELKSLGFAIHLGSTACEASSETQQPAECANPNRATVVLEGFDPVQNIVVADLAALVANSNLATNQPDTAPGCMSSPDDEDCVGIMGALGLPFNGTSAPTQSFFKMK